MRSISTTPLYTFWEAESGIAHLLHMQTGESPCGFIKLGGKPVGPSPSVTRYRVCKRCQKLASGIAVPESPCKKVTSTPESPPEKGTNPQDLPPEKVIEELLEENLNLLTVLQERDDALEECEQEVKRLKETRLVLTAKQEDKDRLLESSGQALKSYGTQLEGWDNQWSEFLSRLDLPSTYTMLDAAPHLANKIDKLEYKVRCVEDDLDAACQVISGIRRYTRVR